jgi:hypothetical protein
MIWMRRIGLGLLFAWAGFWVWFNLASAFGEPGAHGPARIEVGHLAMAAVIAAVSVAAWRWPKAGSPALLALSAYGCWFFGFKPFLLVSLLAPPVVAALLLLAAAIGKRAARS